MERRKLNLNAITGMDIRDFNVDQTKAREIINLVKDKDGWRLRDSKLDVYTGLSSANDVAAFIMQNDKVIIAIDQAVYIYALSNDVIGSLLEKYTLNFDFKMYKTNYPFVYFVIDTTNHKSYIMEFSDRVLTFINDAGNLEVSSELILHEYDSKTEDLIWSGMCRHNPYDSATLASMDAFTNAKISDTCAYITLLTASTASNFSIGYRVNVCSEIREVVGIVNTQALQVNSAFTVTNACTIIEMARCQNGLIYNNSINKYMIQWDTQNIGTANEWHQVAVLQHISPTGDDSRYVIVCGKGAETHAYIYDYNDYTPYKWTTKMVNTSNNIFKTDGTGALNDKARFCDVVHAADAVYYTVSYWEKVSDSFGMIRNIKYNTNANVYYTVTDGPSGYIYYYNGTGSTLYSSNNAIPPVSTYQSMHFVNANCIVTAHWWNTFGCVTKHIGPSNIEKNYWGNMGDVSPDTITGVHYVSDTNIYITGRTGIYHCNGSAVNANLYVDTAATLVNAYSNVCSGDFRALHYVSGSNLYFVKYGSGVWNWDGATTWTNCNAGLTGAQANMTCFEYVNGTYFVAGTEGEGVVYWNGTTWQAMAKPSLGADLNIQAVDYVNTSYILAGSDAGTYVYNGTQWDKLASGTGLTETNVISVTYGSPLKQYSGTMGGLFETGITVSEVNTAFDIYVPNADAIARLRYDTSDLLYTASSIGLSGKDCKAVECIDTLYSDGTRFSYAICANEYGSSTAIDVYLIGKSGASDYRESNTNGTACVSSASLTNTLARFNYVNFVGITVIANQYYELQDSNQKGFTVITCYTDNGNTRFDNIDLVLGTSVNTLTMERKGIGAAINASSIGYMGTTQAFVWATGQASIYSQGQTHYVYTNKDMRVIKYPISNTQMTTADTTEITYLYNNEISRYCDPDGIIAGGIVTNPKGYVLTEINKSKKAPVRPDFYIDLGDSSYGTTSANAFECFITYELAAPDGSTFKTPINADNGGKILAYDDSNANHHKYWIIYLMESGLLDDTIPFINLVKGQKNDTTGTYDVKFWKQNADLLSKVYPDNTADQIDGLPFRFNNLVLESNDDGDNIIGGKVFYKFNDSERDLFDVSSYFQNEKGVLFEIQDMIFTANQLLLALDYSDKVMYYGNGFKYLNLLNNKRLPSRATAIQEIGNNLFAVACENDIFIGMATGEDALTMSLLATNVGLEQGNYASLVTNGTQAFFHNRRGLWMIKDYQVIDISGPIGQYLYRQSSGNIMGIDGNSNSLFIPLDYSQMTNLQCEFRNADYTYTTTTNVNFNKAFAVFDYSDLSFKIFAYEDDQSSYSNFFGNMTDHLIARVGSKLIVPQYQEADGTEKPLARFVTKRASFGNVQSLKKLYDLLFYYINNPNIAGNQYGIDYFKLLVRINRNTDWKRKYGDFDSTATYGDGVTADNVSPDSSTTGWLLMKIPLGLDFNDIEIWAEFARFADSNASLTTLNSIDIDIIQQNLEKFGMR